jgi:hypothetical protein
MSCGRSASHDQILCDEKLDFRHLGLIDSPPERAPHPSFHSFRLRIGCTPCPESFFISVQTNSAGIVVIFSPSRPTHLPCMPSSPFTGAARMAFSVAGAIVRPAERLALILGPR